VAKIGVNRKARNSLTVEVILDAAEEVAAGGFEAVTIRAVATALEASPMALYRYFSTKDELVDALLNRVLGRFAAPAESSNWLEDLGAFARAHESLLIEHPWAIAPLIARPFPGANALPIGEVALRILERGGIVGDDAVATFSGLLALNYGRASFAVSRGDEGGVAAAERIAQLPSMAADYPATARSAQALGRYGSDEHYEHVLGQLLAGIGGTRGS
jgi:AcrR family transcriptional regulator